MADGGFATLLTCIDGRIQQALSSWVSAQFNVAYVDTITEPGVDSFLATADDASITALIDKVTVSRRAHGSRTVVVAAHSDCAGNPVPDEEHRRQLELGLARLERRLPGVRLVAVHVGQCGTECWEPRPVAEVPATGR
jgi:hypothetical protein